nr:MAG TPA: hypothetical protein [Caudoviricetes sp.]
MNNRNVLVNIEAASYEATTKRCLNMLEELLKAQDKVMRFLVSEGLDDSLEGETIADHMGGAIRAFSGILGDRAYQRVVNKV